MSTLRERARRIFAAAATAVVGGAALAAALLTANQQDAEPLGCADLRELARLQDAEAITFYVAAATGYAPPTAVGDRVLGDCAGGVCVVAAPTACPGETLSYRFLISPPTAGWRLAEVRAHPYFAGGWKALAAVAGSSSLRFWGSRQEVAAACLAVTTAANCRALAASVQGANCWRRADGTFCRNGRVYGPGVGGVNGAGAAVTCTPGAGDEWYSCDDGGSGRPAYAEEQRTAAMPPDQALDF